MLMARATFATQMSCLLRCKTHAIQRMPSILRDLHREGAKLTFLQFSLFGALSHFDTADAIKMLF